MSKEKTMQRFFLAEEHVEKAKELCKECRISPYSNGKLCHNCGETGVDHIREDDNCVMPCETCVSLRPLYLKWWRYIQNYPGLKRHYKAFYDVYNK